ncbi:MAG: PAS domain S-box protein [Leptospiraceae bacterium]|nr:PAS domain S-box protein [Leptospiraceae bacterium]
MNNKIPKVILLVEDEILIAMVQKKFLEQYGYNVITIETGEKAVEILKSDMKISEICLLPDSRKIPLEKFGYKVIMVDSAERAVNAYKANDNIDLVLMDIDLGKGMDGTEAAEIILKHRNIPIVFLSSHTEQEIVEKTEKITSYGYVVKNSNITVLDASIKMAFKLFDANEKIQIELLERKKADEMLSVSETRYRLLFETTKEGILILDAKTGMILDVNPFLINLLGYSYNLLMGKTIWDIGFLKDVVGNKDKFLELQKNKYARYENLPLETTYGKIIEVEFISNVFEVSNLKFIQCNIRDITDRKETEIGLEKTRKELEVIKVAADEASEFAESVINTVREPLIALDKDLRVVSVSRSFYDFFKVKPEDTVGQLIYDLGNKQWDIPKLRELLETILPQKTSFDNYEVEHDFATIGKRIMLLNARQIQQRSGKKSILLLAIEDITERKDAEKKIKALLAEKELILKEVHHRIKNSMNTIKSLLTLQAAMLKDPTAIEALTDTESRVQSMMLLYDKLYRSTGYIEISIKDYLFSLIDEIIENFPNGDSITVQKNMDDFICDAKKLQSIGIIINELLTNIMKYAFLGKENQVNLIEVSVILKNNKASIVIKDNGVGIPENIDFENSTGFGLTLVRLLTEQIGGTIGIERKNGTSVILEFEIY